MLRNLAIVVSFVCLAFVSAIITSCGSSGTHLGTMCTGGPFNVVGNWQGTLTTGGTLVNVSGVINTSGQAVFFDSDSPQTDNESGSVAVLPTITGTCSFSGNASAFGSFGAGGGSASGTASGNVNSATSISGTVTINGTKSNFSFSSFTPLSGSIAALSGSKGGSIQGISPSLLPLTFQATGTGNNMSFTNNTLLSNCTTSGTFTQEGANNIFDVSITFSGTGNTCPAAGTVAGLGFESNTDYFAANNNGQGTYLYAVSSTSAFVLEVYP
jgi:hypothetical protein